MIKSMVMLVTSAFAVLLMEKLGQVCVDSFAYLPGLPPISSLGCQAFLAASCVLLISVRMSE